MESYFIDGDGYDAEKCPWSDVREQIRKVVFEETVTTVGDFAFYGCENLESVEFSEGIQVVGLWVPD